MMFLAALALAQAAVPHIDGHLAPRDECAALPGFAGFRAALWRAVKQRDAAALAGLSDVHVELDYGGGAGRQTLTRRLRGGDGRELWQALDKLADLGCAYQKRVAAMPWIYSKDLGNIDIYEAQLVMGRDVPLYAAASGGKVLARMDWVLARQQQGWVEHSPRQPVQLVGRKEKGYVEASRLRSPIDYRLLVERKQGRWLITAFIAGD